jgi:hypothetical protein
MMICVHTDRQPSSAPIPDPSPRGEGGTPQQDRGMAVSAMGLHGQDVRASLAHATTSLPLGGKGGGWGPTAGKGVIL